MGRRPTGKTGALANRNIVSSHWTSHEQAECCRSASVGTHGSSVRWRLWRRRSAPVTPSRVSVSTDEPGSGLRRRIMSTARGRRSRRTTIIDSMISVSTLRMVSTRSEHVEQVNGIEKRKAVHAEGRRSHRHDESVIEIRPRASVSRNSSAAVGYEVGEGTAIAAARTTRRRSAAGSFGGPWMGQCTSVVALLSKGRVGRGILGLTSLEQRWSIGRPKRWLCTATISVVRTVSGPGLFINRTDDPGGRPALEPQDVRV